MLDNPGFLVASTFFGRPTANILTDVSSFSVASAAGIIQETHIRGLSELASDTIGVTGLAGRYASALFELAEEQNALDQVANDVRTLSALIDGNDELTRMVRSPRDITVSTGGCFGYHPDTRRSKRTHA